MYICKNCGQRFSASTAFCDNCGSSMIEPIAPPDYDYSYSGADIHVAPARPGGKAQSIVSMILGIESMCGAFLSLFYAFITIAFAADIYNSYSYYDYYHSVGTEIAGFAVVTFLCAIVHFILGIVALLLGCIAKAKGSHSAMAWMGIIFGIIAIIVSAVAFCMTADCISYL